MFNDKFGLTKAVLEGRKTQTRRIDYDFRQHACYKVIKSAILPNGSITYMDGNQQVLDDMPKPLYKIGEEVAIAQKYSELEYGVDWVRRSIHKEHAGWNNKMFVSAEEMPHHIKINNIRIERLQDISEDDCLKEGIMEWNPKDEAEGVVIKNLLEYNERNGHFPFQIPRCWNMYDTPRQAFADLIDKISSKGTWESNPWVFVYDFELIK